MRLWLLTDAATRWLLAGILVAGAYLRLTHLDWDQGWHIHPDERFLTMVVSAMDLPDSLKQFFDSTQSPMNPFNRGFGFFVYGTLPLFIVRVVAEVAQKINETAHLWEVAPGILRSMTGYDGVHLVGRFMSGLFDLACVWLTFVIGRRLHSRKVGLLAAALYAFAVLPLQQSHFFTVDTFGTFFALVTFYFAVRVAQGGERGRHGGGWGSYLGLGAGLGASLACRINLAPLAGIALLAAGIRAWDDWGNMRADGGRRGNGMLLSTLLQATLFRLVLMVLVAFVVFRVAQPYTFGGTSVWDLTFAPDFRNSMRTISMIIRGDADQPPMHQWANRTPFVFPWVNMVVWGMGVPLGVAAWAGWALAAWQVVRGLTLRPDPQAVRAHLLPVVWAGGMFVYHSMQFSYTMRYYLPIYPTLVMLAAWLLWWLVERANQRLSESTNQRISESANADLDHSPFAIRHSLILSFAHSFSSLPWHRLAYGLLVVVTVFTILWGWGFLAIYRRPLTRITASKWMYQNIPEGSVVANEHWDDPLPGSFDGKLGFKPAGYYYGLTDPNTGRREGQIENYAEDTPEKRERLYRWLNEADVIVMSSNRLWGSIPRLPMRYPMTSLYYQLMAEEKLGFELAARFTSFPTIFGIQFDDTWAEEAFSVYDHPEVRIYRKTPAYSEALARSYFDKIDLEQVIMMWPKQVTQAPTALYLTPDQAARQRAGGTWSEIFDLDAWVNRSQVLAVLVWLALLFLLGLIAFPITFVVLRGLGDRGYGVSKVLGALLLAWLSWFGPGLVETLHATSLLRVPYTRWWIAFCLGLLIGISAAMAWRRRHAIAAFVRERRNLLLTEEAIFLVLFGLFLLIRIGNPDLWHPARGGEKPMEFAYLNAVIRSTTFPPYDPWHAGGYMNYYYFGFVIVGTLVKLTGIVPWVAYNLAVPTLFALTGLAAFSVAFNLADGDPATEFPGEEGPYHGMRIGSLLAGLAGVFFVTIVGNFGNFKLLLDQLAQRAPGGAGEGAVAKVVAAIGGLIAVLIGQTRLDFPNDWWFWNASRVIPDTINEFPFFTFTYADLHAHMIALPLTLLALAAAVAVVRLGDAGTRGRGGTEEGEPSPWCISLPELLPLLLAGFVIGALRATNTWDFPTFLLAVLAAVVVLEGARRSRMAAAMRLGDADLAQVIAFGFRAVVAVVWRIIVVFVVATITFYPYTRYYATAYSGLQMWQDAKTTLPDYLTVWGFFLALAVIFLAAELIAQVRDRQVPPWLQDLVPSIVVVTLALIAAGYLLKARIWLIAVPLFVLAAFLALGRDLPPARRLGLLLLALALAITMGVEVVRLKDDIGRMNTVFKFYMQAWTLFGISTAFGLAIWAPRSLRWRPEPRRLAVGLTVLLFLGTLLYPPFAARAKIRDRFSAEASPRGLDGMAYMEKALHFENGRDVRLADDREAMLWLLQNLKGSPVILEAQIPEYRWGSRFSVYTGLPTVQGWNWHQRQQRSVVPAVVERRVRHVEEIYNTLDLPRAQHLLDTYNVSYIIIGELERAYYQPAGLAKFETLVAQGYLEPVYQKGSVTIYEVVGRGMRVMPVITTTIGPQPVPTPTEAVSPLPTPASFESPQS
ncbi:MAG: DUF2298 domain-containing protein [Anaerolineae bacterium]|nr:DUF2298 domain-containing protein [Anaerolineae bacterium]